MVETRKVAAATEDVTVAVSQTSAASRGAHGASAKPPYRYVKNGKFGKACKRRLITV